MPVPDRLNAALVAGVSLGAVALLWLGSVVASWWTALAVGVVFSYLMLTNYALLHEATHGNLQTNPRRNYALGLLAGMLFPMPFSMICRTHRGHHLHNRTDAEMFDLYYPHDNLVLKYVRWYGILCGLFWPLIPIGAVLFCGLPAGLRARVFEEPASTGYIFRHMPLASVWKVRAELLLVIAFFAAAFWTLDLDWRRTLLLYACFSLNWSTRQYVGHAFTRRDVIEGAWNLRTNRVMSALLLHSELDLAHHRRPDVSWVYLPRFLAAGETRPSYLRQYWRQWRGPRPSAEFDAAPAPR